VVFQNLHHVCVFKVAKEHKKPSLWWDYVSTQKSVWLKLSSHLVCCIGICFLCLVVKCRSAILYTELVYNLQALIIKQ
jgi:hypothetical protein